MRRLVPIVATAVCLVLFFKACQFASRRPEINRSGLTGTTYYPKEGKHFTFTMVGQVQATPAAEEFNHSMDVVAVRFQNNDGDWHNDDHDAGLVAKADHIKPGDWILCKKDNLIFDASLHFGQIEVFGCEPSTGPTGRQSTR
jgi:hypothetical protein